MRIYSIRGNNLKRHSLVASGVGGGALTVLGLINGKITTLVLGLLILGRTLIKKPVFVTQEGLYQIRDYRFFKTQTFWDFKDLDALYWKDLAQEGFSYIYFEKNQDPQAFDFKEADKGQIISWVKERHPQVEVKEIED
ncbi:MAG: hypothetical protein Q4E37_06620 [Tissierellia bacterium]|nr:hypothetical protein [Tissierellia bacterium]